MTLVPISDLMTALRNIKKGTLREAFEGEEPDFVHERDKLCTGVLISRDGEGFAADFDPPILMRAGIGYVFEELPK